MMMILMINVDVDSGVERGTGGWIFFAKRGNTESEGSGGGP